MFSNIPKLFLLKIVKLFTNTLFLSIFYIGGAAGEPGFPANKVPKLFIKFSG
jgi:hypothetical protein